LKSTPGTGVGRLFGLLRNVPPRQSRLEVWIAAGILAAVAWPKLFWWDGPVTLLTGIAAAALLAVVS